MSLKKRAVKGISWAFADQFANNVIQFVIGIVLARLLSPQEYGLVGMLAIFMAVADTFVVAGYGEALIRKKAPTAEDYNTTFVVNVLTGFLFYLLFLILAGPISRFFREPELAGIIKVLGLSIIISAFALVARVPLIKELNFKSLAKISVASTLLSGIVAIVLAVKGYGVWSLVWRSVAASLVGTGMVYLIARPRLRLQFNRSAFGELFGFGSKLLFSRLFNEIYSNMLFVLIGKFFSTRELGLYTRANGYKDLPSRMLNNVIQSVSFPALAELKDDDERLRAAFRRVMQATMYLTFTLMFCLAGCSESFIIGLIGEQWREAIPYLQLLCFVGVFYPLHYLNLSILVVKGFSGLHLKIEIVTKLLVLPAIALGLLWGIKWMIAGLIVVSVADYAITATLSGRPIQYGLGRQLADLWPSLLFGLVAGAFLYFIGTVVPVPPLPMLLIQGALGLAFVILVSDILRLRPYLEMKQIIMEKLRPAAADLSGSGEEKPLAKRADKVEPAKIESP